MTKQDIFNYFYTNSANFGVRNIVFTMLGGLLIGFIIYLTYKFSHRSVSSNQRFNAMLIVVLQISIVIMLMISSNIVISLGMVGALSIVRFRTAIKDPKDTMFIFWSISSFSLIFTLKESLLESKSNIAITLSNFTIVSVVS